MGSDDHREVLRAMSEAMAPGWERRRARLDAVLEPVRRWMVRELAPAPGETVLELAAASGDTGLEAAALVGDEGRLISTDLTAAMVEIGRRRAAEVGARNVEHRVMDAERIDLPDGSVDGVLCRFAYMLMADPAGALAETRRVLRPGGRVALAVWGPPERTPWIATAARVLVEAGHVPPPTAGDPSPFSLADPERTATLLAGAGLARVRTEDVPVTAAFRDADDYMSLMEDTAGPLGIALRELPATAREDVRRRLQDALEPFAADDGLALPGLALCAVASAP